MECVHKYAWFMAKWDVANQKIEVSSTLFKSSCDQTHSEWAYFSLSFIEFTKSQFISTCYSNGGVKYSSLLLHLTCGLF